MNGYVFGSKHKNTNNNNTNALVDFDSTHTFIIKDLHMIVPYNHSFKHPIHIEPYHIPYLSNQMENGSIYITPKADGIRTHIKFNNSILEVERMVNNNRTQYIIIDLVKNQGKDPGDFEDRYKDIGKIMNNTDLNIINIDLNDDFIQKIKNTIQKYNNNFNHSSNIFTKPIFKIKSDKTITKDILKNFFSILDEKPDTSYPNDGWIIYVENKKTPLKFKPIRDMTIDLKYNGTSFTNQHLLKYIDSHDIYPIKNKVYRFCWEKSEDKWIIESLRSDKTEGNRDDIIKSILNRIYNPWKTSDVIEKYFEIGRIYYDKMAYENLNCAIIQDLLKKQKERSLDFVMDYIEDHSIVLDLGCGNSSINRILTKKGKIKHYYGIDKDPVVLSNNLRQMTNQTLMWGDVNEGFDFEYFTKYFDNIPDHSIDCVISINTINYFDIEKLIPILNKKTKENAQFLVFTLYQEKMHDIDLGNFNINGIPKPFYIKRIPILDQLSNKNNKYEFCYPWRDHIFEETIIDQNLVNDLQKNKWGYAASINYKIYDNNDIFNKFHHMFIGFRFIKNDK